MGKSTLFLVSNFRIVLNVVLFLFGESSVFESDAWESPKRKNTTKVH